MINAQQLLICFAFGWTNMLACPIFALQSIISANEIVVFPIGFSCFYSAVLISWLSASISFFVGMERKAPRRVTAIAPASVA